MKLGLISDIHGDLKALERALSLLRHKHAAQAIWCAGDLVGRGTQPNEVVQRIIQERIPTVMGNHDEMVLLMSEQARQHPLKQNNTGDTAPLWQPEHYRPQTLQQLSQLPRTYRSRMANKTLVMVHGSPRSNIESISLNPLHRARELAWLDKVQADVLVTGHTHTPLLLHNQRGLIVNPGSLFDPTHFRRASSQTYGLLDLGQMRFTYYPLWD